jgi:acidic leucine-rich nuclear phosphoprotein 32 family protein B
MAENFAEQDNEELPMGQRVIEELAGAKPDQVNELVLDGSKSDFIDGVTAEFVNLEYLSMSNCGLKSLKGMPPLPKLQRLDVMFNDLVGSFECLSSCPSLVHVNLSDNKIARAEDLAGLAQLPDLRSVDLFNCPVGEPDGYRDNVFTTVPHLVYIDGLDRDGGEADDSDDEGLEEAGSSEEEDEDEDYAEGADEDDDVDEGNEDEDEDEDEGEGEDDDDEGDAASGAADSEPHSTSNGLGTDQEIQDATAPTLKRRQPEQADEDEPPTKK